MAVTSLRKEVSEEDPELQEQEHVHLVYNEIASHFSQTRYKPWPIVEKFLQNRQDYSIGIDVGCGNGKYLGVNDKLFMIGTDRSDGLIGCGKEVSANKYNLGVADGLSLPHQDNRFDFAISIAVIHHFTTEERRVQAIQHILGKLRTGGELLVYCWALEQENSRRGYKEGDDQDILIPWVLQKKQPKKDKPRRRRRDKEIKEEEVKQEEVKEEEVKEEEKDIKYRYYHLYKKGELHENALRAGNCTIVEEGYEKDNWWIIIRKS
ncbi:S-adenosyl-L-methionine-dependent methyltransferase [Hyphopichia burtonii NRRL Y-1933]|uniref:S-adenosyl-L-methionine-dependent methyltransferase n=1 Tax=Hyphopichia burtonii NRRL Y-1933 TaxID=984485 RepID=A0A1E4RDP3_9ASCO|nr:S-adenosyl-L-methionine-dependent methyltransferase [Hyphopichia burtonii NRRL Y-1933]ODV65235.1 S-adenosyl-L-methionine-dependent methyltransferase [Hyphopichia burtonii NRRL Y-1933]